MQQKHNKMKEIRSHSMKQPIVDQNICIGCGTCAALASATFTVDPATGKAKVINPTGNSEAEIDTAIASCPGGAITWTEE